MGDISNTNGGYGYRSFSIAGSGLNVPFSKEGMTEEEIQKELQELLQNLQAYSTIQWIEGNTLILKDVHFIKM